MEVSQELTNSLIDELESSIRVILENGQTEVDWRVWNELVLRLSEHLHKQLYECQGKFSCDMESVGKFALNSAILDSLQELRQKTNH